MKVFLKLGSLGLASVLSVGLHAQTAPATAPATAPSTAPSTSSATAPATQPAVKLEPFSSAESARRLARSKAKVDFAPLANNFENQQNKFFCGPTSVAIVLNALSVKPAPTDPALYRGSTDTLPANFDPVYARFTQYAVFDAKSDSVKSLAEVFGKLKAGVKDYGFQLAQLDAFIRARGVESQAFVVDEKLDRKKAKADIVANLQNKDDYVLVNYARKAVGQEGGGHISPVAAYDATSDSFLVLDVNPNAAPWVWVKSNDLFNAMATFDTVANRGFLLVRAPTVH